MSQDTYEFPILPCIGPKTFALYLKGRKQYLPTRRREYIFNINYIPAVANLAKFKLQLVKYILNYLMLNITLCNELVNVFNLKF